MPLTTHSSQTRATDDSIRCVVDENGHFVFVSPAMGWALGSSAEKLVSQPVGSVLEIVSSLDSHHQSTDLNNAVSGLYEVALLRQHRDPLVLQSRIDVIDAPNGKAYKVIWLDPDNLMNLKKSDTMSREARNFTLFVVGDGQTTSASKPKRRGRKKKQEALSEDQLKVFLELSNDLLAIYSEKGEFQLSNPAFNMLLGFSEKELKERSFTDLIYPEDQDYVAASINKAKVSSGIHKGKAEFTSRVYSKSGGVRYIEWTYKLAEGCAYIVGNDVTDIKRHEEELSHRESLLLEAQKIGRMGHWSWDVKRGRMDWSDQIYTMFGLERGRFIPTIKNISECVFEDDKDKIYSEFQKVATSDKEYDIQFRISVPEGGVRYIHCEGRSKKNVETGEVETLFGIMQDITDRTLHERALCEAKEAAETAYASKTRFLANMSHELRTPLNAIIGFSEMMQRQLLGPLGNPRYLDYLSGIIESGEHLLDLISDILDMSKMEIGKYEIDVEELNVTKLIRLAVHMVEGRAHEGGVRLVAEDVPEDVRIVADRRAVMQILINLMSNAVKFTPEGGEVTIRCSHEFGSVEIEVSDTGIGIPEDKIDIVTMPFEQVGGELVRKHEGSGLGLAITKDLVEMHEGKMSIISEEGKGTSVSVLLPEKSDLHTPVEEKTTEFVPV